MDGATGP